MVSTLIEIEHIADFITDKGFGKVIVEAGHYYADDQKSPLGDLDKAHAETGILLATKLGRHLRLVDAEFWWFIDELHRDDIHHNGNGSNGNGNGNGKDNIVFTPDPSLHSTYVDNGRSPKIVFESCPVLLGESIKLVENLMERSESAESSYQFIKRYRKGISFVTPYDHKEYILCERDKQKQLITPKCCTIDAALYLRKFHAAGNNGVAVTFLPESEAYREQQKTTKMILEQVGYANAILNIYFDDRGRLDFEANF